ncbi:hypothetical protein Glove_37g87 [Diversispora epigaea]|uniref:Protein kinase domain-containing protein n=1 Tax=Diversispora epigaea TaxID=1348612 RepID=A0A397JG42_9GLOM|nr:hypothetical protein Glove_37g87 [Diversispora epigaea]
MGTQIRKHDSVFFLQTQPDDSHFLIEELSNKSMIKEYEILEAKASQSLPLSRSLQDNKSFKEREEMKEVKEIKEIEEMKETRKSEEMKETGETEELQDAINVIKLMLDHPCNAKRFQNEFDKWINYEVENWKMSEEQEVCLKNLYYSTNKIGFLQEIKNKLTFCGKNGISIYVMNYAKYGSLQKLLNNNFVLLTWRRKSSILSTIVIGLKNIHKMGLMHKDFHSGNIVNQTLNLYYITDFELCKPVIENDPEKIYGVIPYMAPERKIHSSI